MRELQQTLEHTRTKLKVDYENLGAHKSERAKLAIQGGSANAVRLKELDNLINTTHTDISNGNDVIKELEKQLASEAATVAQVQKNELLDAQKTHSRNVEKYSKQLVEALSEAVAINDQLRNACNGYKVLREKTGVDTVSQNVCQGSFGSLKEIHAVCVAEVSGQRQMRKPHTTGITPI